MSDTVHYKGKLTPTNKKVEEYCKDGEEFEDAIEKMDES